MKRLYTDEELVTAVASNITIAGTLRTLGLPVRGDYYRPLHKHLKRLNINISHWKGQAHGKSGKINEIPIHDQLINGIDPSSSFKSKLIKYNILDNSLCNICGIQEWQNKPITLQLNHINGDRRDNRRINLELICPNCHSQTETYTGRNAFKYGNKKSLPKKLCACGKEIKKKSKKCKKCNNIEISILRSRNNYPDITVLLDMLYNNSFRSVGRVLGVSDTAIRKRLIKLGIDPKSICKI